MVDSAIVQIGRTGTVTNLTLGRPARRANANAS